MYFKNEKEFNNLISGNNVINLGKGSQGECYYDAKTGNVYKKIHWYEEENIANYSKDEILQFKDINTKSYYFPIDVIMVGNKISGIVTKYACGRNLFDYSPFYIKLDKFIEDIGIVYDSIDEISYNGIASYDVAYNIVYCYENGFGIIDTLEYSQTGRDITDLIIHNRYKFNYAIRKFLIDGIFDEFIKDNYELMDLYRNKNISMIEFLSIFKCYLSVLSGRKVEQLSDVYEYANKNKKLCR